MELLLFIAELMSCGPGLSIDNGQQFFYQGHAIQCESPEACAVDDFDFAVVVDGKYMGWLANAECRIVGDSGETALHLDLVPWEYWGSGFVDVETFVSRSGFEG